MQSRMVTSPTPLGAARLCEKLTLLGGGISTSALPRGKRDRNEGMS
jgi:hypothetical protein